MNQIPILVVDDDKDDCLLAQEAFEESRLNNPLFFVYDGSEALRYLLGEPPYENRTTYPIPGLILLDLNMPKMDGRKLLTKIKGDERFRHIPVLIMTTSKEEAEVVQSYNLGCAGFITKPVEFEELVKVCIGITDYWFSIVRLPKVSP